jgi:hypothetical protein
MSVTLVIDTGVAGHGRFPVTIYEVEKATFAYYPADDTIPLALPRILQADEVVTFNGGTRDLVDLAFASGLEAGQDLPLAGRHTDMMSVCWDVRDLFGKGLRACYLARFGQLPTQFEDTYEGHMHRDVYMTLRLWELARDGKLSASSGGVSAA